MKEIKELKFEELTTKQKLGLVHTPCFGKHCTDEDAEYILNLIRNHSLGAVWVQWNPDDNDVDSIRKYVNMVKEAADYPIIIITDAELGLGEYKIGQHNPIGCAGTEEHAYAFGKATAATARDIGYNLVCNPLLDLTDEGSQRTYGCDKHLIAKLAAAEARGLHDGGLLTIGKHYPSAFNSNGVDSHMTEGLCYQTEEELLDRDLYAYLELMKEGLLDGVMPAHNRFINIDDSAPASLSKKVLNVLRKQGFDGVMMTDALCMMGIRAKFGRVESIGLAIEAGNDFALIYDAETEFNQNALYECYERGIISDEALDNAVKRILALQHKAFLMQNPKSPTLTEEEARLAKNVNIDSIYTKVDEGLLASLPRDGKYYFALMTRNEFAVGTDESVAVDTFSNGWHFPVKITNKIKEMFPNSYVQPFFQFPTQSQMVKLLEDSIDYDDIIFITFSEFLAYTGKEHLTRRVATLIEAMQYTDRISTLIHYGNPKVLEELPHIPRIIFGGVSTASTLACIDVLAGEIEAKGRPTYELNLK